MLAAERAEAEHTRLYAEITHHAHGEVPAVLKGLLWLGAACVACAVYGATLFSRRCFADFAIHPSFDEQVRADSSEGSGTVRAAVNRRFGTLSSLVNVSTRWRRIWAASGSTSCVTPAGVSSACSASASAAAGRSSSGRRGTSASRSGAGARPGRLPL